jgi:hypothetical protein
MTVVRDSRRTNKIHATPEELRVMSTMQELLAASAEKLRKDEQELRSRLQSLVYGTGAGSVVVIYPGQRNLPGTSPLPEASTARAASCGSSGYE